MTCACRFVVVLAATAAAVSAQCGLVWSGLASPPNAQVGGCCATKDGGLVVSGSFTSFAGVAANRIIRRSGATWSPLGAGLDGPAGVLEMPNGDLIAAGTFTLAGGTPAQNIARWDGSMWSPLGSGTDNSIFALAVLPNGDLVAGGMFTSAGGVPANRIARWDGSVWSALGQGTALPVFAIAPRPNGDVAFCSFDPAHNTLAKVDVWNGSTVTNLLTRIGGQFWSLRTLTNGDLVLGGMFDDVNGTPTNGLARWNGFSWNSMGLQSGSAVRAIDQLPGGDVLIGGRLFLAGSTVRVARIGTAGAVALESPVSLLFSYYMPNTMAVLDGGQVAFGGQFQFLGTATSPYFATLDATCPASATAFGAGCVGSAGPNVLTATSLPWIGGAFRSQATGMQANSLVALVTGFTALAVPLTAVFGAAVTGCTGYVTPDSIGLFLPTNGTFSSQLSIPANPALVGVVFHQYALPLEFDALGNVVAITSSNGLTMTVGAF